MHNNHLSATETAIKFNLGNHNVVCKWKRIYYEEGPHALYKERLGRLGKMSSKQKKKELEKDIIEYIEYYNNRKIKSKLKGMSPVQYRQHSLLVA